MHDLKTRLVEFMDRVWVRGDLAAVQELMAPGAVVNGLEATTLQGPEDFIRFHKMVARQFDNMSFRTLRAVQDGVWVAAMGEISGTEKRTGLRAVARVHYMVRYEDGLIAEVDNLVDFLGLFEQLGRLPQRTLDLCLTDQRLEVAV